MLESWSGYEIVFEGLFGWGLGWRFGCVLEVRRRSDTRRRVAVLLTPPLVSSTPAHHVARRRTP
jgi:hypothetical protein